MPSASTVPFINGSTRSLNAEIKPRVSFAISVLLLFQFIQLTCREPSMDQIS